MASKDPPKDLAAILKSVNEQVKLTFDLYCDEKKDVTYASIEKKLKTKKEVALLAFDLFSELVDAQSALARMKKQDMTKDQQLKDYKLKCEKLESNQAMIKELKSNTLAVTKLVEVVEEVKNQGLGLTTKVKDTLKSEMQSYSTALIKSSALSKSSAKGIPSITSRKPAKAECIRVVTRPKDVNIKSSKDIRREFNKKFKDVVLERCYATAGGSFFLEVESKEKAEELDADWDNTLFGGNNGLRDATLDNSIGVIKNVVDDGMTEEEIATALRSTVELAKNSRVEFFKHQMRNTGKEVFSGTIKVVFKDSESLQKAITDKIKINGMRCSVEKWEHTVKVKYCYRCLKFGHVSYRCRSKKAKCGKCGFEGHEQKDCTVTNPQLLKCGHCGGKHPTGSYSCKSMRTERERLNSRLLF